MKFPKGEDPIPVSLSGTQSITFSFHLFVHNSRLSKLNYLISKQLKKSQSGTGWYGILYVFNPVCKLWRTIIWHIYSYGIISYPLLIVSYVTLVISFCHHPLISSGNGHCWVFGLHNTCLVDDAYVCTLKPAVVCSRG